MKLKMEKAKHNHLFTNLLKVGIFALLIMLPILNVATRSLYVICNRNAYQSYSGNVHNYIENYNLGIDNLYKIEYTGITEGYTNNTSIKVYPSWTSVDFGIEYEYIRFAYDNKIQIYNSSNQLLQYYTNYNNFYYKVRQNDYYQQQPYFKNYVLEEMPDDLDNVFEYSFDQLQNNQMYNWATNTGLYTGITAMTTNLGITTTIIPMLLTYWLMLTVIYIILDIVIQLFTYLTHIFSKE